VAVKDLFCGSSKMEEGSRELYTNASYKEELTKIPATITWKWSCRMIMFPQFCHAMLLLVPLFHPRFHSTIGHENLLCTLHFHTHYEHSLKENIQRALKE